MQPFYLYDKNKDNPNQSPDNPGNSQSTQNSKEDNTLSSLNEITEKNKNALYDKFNNAGDMYNISDSQIRNLANQQRKQAMANSDDEWFDAMTDLQSAITKSSKTAGNTLTGSSLLDYIDAIDRYDNKIDANTRSSLRKNINGINNDEFESLAANINARNELGLNTEYALRQLANDYLAQRVSVNPDKAHGTEWDNWSNEGANFYNTHKAGPSSPTIQSLLLEDNAGKRANALTNTSYADSSAANQNYFKDLLSSRNRRY